MTAEEVAGCTFLTQGPSRGPQLFKWSYYDYPEGTHLAQKLTVTGMYGLVAGVAVCSMDLPLQTKPKTVAAGLARSVHLCSPFVGMFAAFTSTAFVACRWREKDDPINYMLGGIAAGHVYGAWSRSLMGGFVASMGCAVFGFFKKYAIDNNHEFFPLPVIRESTGLRVRKSDFSLIKERERDWTTDPNEA